MLGAGVLVASISLVSPVPLIDVWARPDCNARFAAACLGPRRLIQPPYIVCEYMKRMYICSTSVSPSTLGLALLSHLHQSADHHCTLA